jgi:vancomycin resistance protein VanJ
MPKVANDTPKVSFRRRFARAIAMLATALVIVVWGIQEVWGESHWLTVYITYAPPIVYLAIPGFALLMALLCLDLKAVLWGLVAATLCLVGVARPSLPLGSQRPAGKPVRVVTWNVHDRYNDLASIRAELERLDPDIVCLQEANAPPFRGCWPKAESVQTDSLIILTRGKIERHRVIKVRHREHYLRPLLEADISLEGMKLTVLDLHLYSYQLAAALKRPSKERARELTESAIEMRTLQIEQVTRWLEMQATPAIVAGDFNTPPRGRLYTRLAQTATDSFAAAGKGFGWTYPHSHPILRIDYIWLTGDLRAIRCGPARVGPSDHLPIVADIVVP